MVEKGCLVYFAYIRDSSAEVPYIDSASVVREFPDVFPTNLSGIPSDKDIDFCIDFISDTQLISTSPYRMAPIELKELKEHLEDLLDKGFIRPNVSPWGAPMLFVKKKDSSMTMCIDYRWSDKCQMSFQKLKTALTTFPMLELHMGLASYSVYCDALCIGLCTAKASVVADALSRKVESMGSLTYLPIVERPLAIDRIKARQFDDPHLLVLKDTMYRGGSKEAVIGDDGIMWLQGRICVPNVDGLRGRYLRSLTGVMQFGKKGKLSLIFICSFEILEKVMDVAYWLELPPILAGVHPVFHVSKLRKYHEDRSQVLDFSTMQLDENLTYEEENR
ncbi:uncharacterized protein [Nicotiana tomentosiformis]|uniref:uncharacterized protein n=1 Tax=Nicotiana tomentosiformis TaxID=4098 RepID=UPI00388C456D